MSIYADTSLLFSLYAADANSARADAWRRVHPVPLPFTAFHRLEFRNALSLAVFRRRFTLQETVTIWQEVETDMARGLLLPRDSFWPRVWLDAETYTLDHTPKVGSRTLDILQVAAAKLLGATEFCTFDARQAEVAGRVGLTSIVP